jgi:hypothetical protein
MSALCLRAAFIDQQDLLLFFEIAVFELSAKLAVERTINNGHFDMTISLTCSPDGCHFSGL